jgi:hypothetical protein
MNIKGFISTIYTKLSYRLLCSYLFFVIVYAVLVLLPSPQPAVLKRYGVSVTGLRLIDLSIIIILAVIWFTGFYGYTKLYKYSKLIRKDKDGQHVYTITQGILLLALWLPISSTLSALLDYIAGKQSSLISAATVVFNYIDLIVPLVGFILIGKGAHCLSTLVRKRTIYNYKLTLLLAALLAYIGIVYMHLIVSSSQRRLIYHLSFWLLSLTIVAPYIFRRLYTLHTQNKNSESLTIIQS